MHDQRAVRRRRAVLAALVALSIALLTAYFGENASGGLHAVQRGVMDVLAPIQEGANRALKPARDLFGWFGDTMDAKDERDQLRAERDRLRREVADLQLARKDYEELRAWRQTASALSLDRYEPIAARVYERSPSTWYSTVVINKGASDGVEKDQPVLNGAGLVGRVKSVSGGSAVVTLLTDQDFGVSAMALSSRRRGSGEPGTVAPAVGGDLLFDLVPRGRLIRRGDRVVTAGTTNRRLPSPFPRGILIGEVRRIDEGDGELDRRIHVRPAADLRRLDVVQVLTEPAAELTADATP
jgi:rod shape-determining protein MreC